MVTNKKTLIIIVITVLIILITFIFVFFNKKNVINRTCKITLPENHQILKYTRNGFYFDAKIQITDEDSVEIQNQLENGDYHNVSIEEQREIHEENTISWWDLKKNSTTKCYIHYDNIYYSYPFGRIPTVTTIYLQNLHNGDTLLYISYCS